MQEGLNQEMLVRGISLVSLTEYAKSRLCGEDLKRFFAQLPADAARSILKAQKGGWYPFELDRRLREAIVREFNPSSPRKAIYDAGLFAASRETSTFLRAMLSFLSVSLVLDKAQAIWEKYCRPGKFRGTLVNEGHAVVELSEFGADGLFCPRVEAWLVVGAKALKLKDAKVTETACIHSGDDVCRWKITWTA